jgi:hypothetical protein
MHAKYSTVKAYKTDSFTAHDDSVVFPKLLFKNHWVRDMFHRFAAKLRNILYVNIIFMQIHKTRLRGRFCSVLGGGRSLYQSFRGSQIVRWSFIK